jgi:hypothetical protein
LSFNFWGFCPKISLKTWFLGDFFNVLNGIYKLTKVNYVWFLFHKFTKWNMCPTASIRLFLSNLDRKFYPKHEFTVLFFIFLNFQYKNSKNEFKGCSWVGRARIRLCGVPVLFIFHGLYRYQSCNIYKIAKSCPVRTS